MTFSNDYSLHFLRQQKQGENLTSISIKQLSIRAQPYLALVSTLRKTYGATLYARLAGLRSIISNFELCNRTNVKQCCVEAGDMYTAQDGCSSRLAPFRTPAKVLPVYKFSAAVRTLLQDPSVRDNLQHWRTQEEQGQVDDETIPPTSEALPFVGKASPMKGFSDGAAWRAQPAYATREFDANGRVTEVVEGPSIFQHSNLRFGLKIALNMDW